MDNQAYKWLTEWLDRGGRWNLNSSSGVWRIILYIARCYAFGLVGFRNDLRQLLADAEAGRKMREGV